MKSPTLGVSVNKNPCHWVQTERKTHEAWVSLGVRKPRAAVLAHLLVANMGQQNAVVIPQHLLAKRMKCSVDTIQRALRDLVAERWIQIVRLGKGRESAYIVNDRVAWVQSRDQLRLSMFSALIVADHADQDPALLGSGELRRIPVLYPGEQQLPSGDGEPPPSQPSIEGLEPDLPALPAETPDYCTHCGYDGLTWNKLNAETKAAVENAHAGIGLTSVSFEDFCANLQHDIDEASANAAQN